MENWANSVCCKTSKREREPTSTSYRFAVNCDRSMPKPVVLFPCGSRSIRRLFFSLTARDAAKLIDVVVLPTPPFWFAIAMTFCINTLVFQQLTNIIPEWFFNITNYRELKDKFRFT